MNTVDAREIQNFSKDSGRWWDPEGPFRPLHRINPVRLRYIKDRICAKWQRDPDGLKSLKGLKLVDIGCGGGLVCEPMARLGAEVTGIDADEKAIAVAKEHAKASGLNIDYRADSSTGLKGPYDIVLALEIAEHVSDMDAFVGDCARLCKPGGLIVFSTLNRTPASFALGIVAAEYILRWVPRGTHDWKKFVRPSELARHLRHHGAAVEEMKGLSFNPLTGEASLSDDLSVNYFLCATL